MAGPRWSDLPEMTDTPAASDLFCLSDMSIGQSRKITYATLMGSTSTQTSSYTITKNKETVLASGEIPIILAPASNAWECWIKNIGASKVTISPATGDTIEGQASFILGNQYEGIHLKSNGGTLWVVF